MRRTRVQDAVISYLSLDFIAHRYVRDPHDPAYLPLTFPLTEEGDHLLVTGHVTSLSGAAPTDLESIQRCSPLALR